MIKYILQRNFQDVIYYLTKPFGFDQDLHKAHLYDDEEAQSLIKGLIEGWVVKKVNVEITKIGGII